MRRRRAWIAVPSRRLIDEFPINRLGGRGNAGLDDSLDRAANVPGGPVDDVALDQKWMAIFSRWYGVNWAYARSELMEMGDVEMKDCEAPPWTRTPT